MDTEEKTGLSPEVLGVIKKEVKAAALEFEDSAFGYAKKTVFMDFGKGRILKQEKSQQSKTTLAMFIYVLLACTSGFITYNESYDSKTVMALAATAVLILPFFGWNLIEWEKSLKELVTQCEKLESLISSNRMKRITFTHKEQMKNRMKLIAEPVWKALLTYILFDGLFFLSIFCSHQYARNHRLDAQSDTYKTLDVACYYLAFFVFLFKRSSISHLDQEWNTGRKKLQESYTEYSHVAEQTEEYFDQQRDEAARKDQEEQEEKDYEIIS
ncbi:hypothetical protein GCK72_017434 [Caenorhabditis remanei]|uniref:Uncharacterized protein n=1 Tax=Caenorhabditis remanei TaxID=31234 RepID=A0A6A5G822_CAERE|nr:hypothetical protein GCK72_017434 [Caenorhabditis remanei]KAF1750883.1 hypothetical protein GCK72_017434 [Caenorhabditis remanei]